MLSGLLHSIMLFGTSFLSRFILKDNQKLTNSITAFVLSWVLFFWFCCALTGLFLFFYGIASHNISILLSAVFILILLAGCMRLIFFIFRRIVEKEEKREARAMQIKFAQQVKIAAQAELARIFTELQLHAPQAKFLIANQVEKQIMALTPADSRALQLRFDSGEQRPLILQQLKHSCASLLTQRTERDADALRIVSARLNSM